MRDERQLRFWRPDTPSVLGMFRVEREDRARAHYAEQFVVVIVEAGAFEGRYRDGVRMHVPGGIKAKAPGEVHRDVRIHAPFTLQGALIAPQVVAAAADALGVRGPVRCKAETFAPDTRAARLAFAMHAVLAPAGAAANDGTAQRAARCRRDGLACETLVVETVAELLDDGRRVVHVDRAVRVARDVLRASVAERVTLDQLAAHARLDKFHLVRAFRAQVGMPPYEYLTHARIARAKELLQRGARVADVAQAVGFCDESQLHRHFRRIVGLTPGRFARCFAPGQHRPSPARTRTAHSTHDP